MTVQRETAGRGQVGLRVGDADAGPTGTGIGEKSNEQDKRRVGGQQNNGIGIGPRILCRDQYRQGAGGAFRQNLNVGRVTAWVAGFDKFIPGQARRIDG